MTKSETREIENLKKHIAFGNIESAARGLSSLIRSARTNKSATELMAIARELNMTNHPEFIA